MNSDTAYNYNIDAYNGLKKEIDQLIKTAKSAAEMEARKGAVLSSFEPYVSFLSEVTRSTPAEVINVLHELGNDDAFFSEIAEDLQLLADQAREGYPTGELRVHSYTDYTVVRLLKPAIMVETGVANGKSSTFILHAMSKNGTGKLYSVDKPNYEGEADIDCGDAFVARQKKVGWLVPERLRPSWSLSLGDSKLVLPELKKEVPSIDIFQHDSLHTYDHMKFEFDLARNWIKKDGLILGDDIQINAAFEEQAQDMDSYAFGSFGGLRFRL